MYVIDSDILIDYLRLYPKAVTFLDELPKKERSLAFISQFELLKGCASKEQEARISRFMKQFNVLPLTESVSKTALSIFRVKHWFIGIGIVDSFIAATALANKCTLVTRNVKHYQGIESLSLHTPYS